MVMKPGKQPYHTGPERGPKTMAGILIFLGLVVGVALCPLLPGLVLMFFLIGSFLDGDWSA